MQTRKTTTKSDIKQALTILLKDKRLEDISISQLTKKAGINRSTFYLHYLDKQDMLEQLKEESESHIREILFKKAFNPQQALEDALNYFYENISFYKAIIKESQFMFSESVYAFMMGVIDANPRSKSVIAKVYQMPERYAVPMLISGFVGLLSNWILTGAQESPQELTAILIETPGLSWFKGEE